MASPILTAVITNATSTPGMAIARHLARAGYDLILVDAERPRLNAFADTLTTTTRQAVEVLVVDVGTTGQRQQLIDHIAQDETVALIVDVDLARPDTGATAEDRVYGRPPVTTARGPEALVPETLARLALRGRTPDVCRASVILF